MLLRSSRVQTECEKFRAEPNLCLESRIQFAGRRVSYPFRKSTLRKIEEDAGHIRGSVSFSLDILQLKSNNRIEDGVSAVRSLLERTHSRQTSFAIRAWLQAPDISVNHNVVYPKHHPNTGLWLTNGPQFANWLVERSSFLWLNGFAGCGKSVLCAAAIQSTFRGDAA
ncbi:unnamed protein product [Penicillium olsonii]|uniref:Nephrocystin 3-like N-terminal domain-containing protein n=1 Tax=Penicillium olsonii TaxID=99116 RepID=A0A9W4N8U6_PENOL|nr:unnamed protein product [Penicillium olsonii]CAG8300306.1 unnamed protein product [Penicillium olsonii]